MLGLIPISGGVGKGVGFTPAGGHPARAGWLMVLWSVVPPQS